MAPCNSKPPQEFLSSIALLILTHLLTSVTAHPWKEAHATFYGAADGSDTFGGACGYDQAQEKEIYGVNTTALSPALFKDGKKCGACFQIKCAKGTKGCKPGHDPIFVTATNLCPPTGWCSGSKRHFDLTQPAFLRIADYSAGIVPVKYRRVPCKKHGGVRFTITGNPYFNMVSIANVGGSGTVDKLEVKGGKRGKWKSMRRNWGQKWDTDAKLMGQELSFRVCNQKWDTDAKLMGQELSFRVATGNGKTFISKKVPENWKFGQTYEGGNFAL